MFLLLLAGLGTGRWEFYFILTIMILLVIAALILNLRTFYSFSCEQGFYESKAVRGESPDFKITIRNKNPFPYTMMQATIEAPSLVVGEKLNINLQPNSSVTYEVPMTCKHRGVFDVGITILEVNSVFGILPMKFDLRKLPNYKLKQVVVYPRLIGISASGVSAIEESLPEGLGVKRLADDGENFYETRQYRYGDPFKRIHRTISARKRQLHVKRYDIPTETSTLLAMDTCFMVDDREENLRYGDIACECGAAIARCYLSLGHAMTLIGSNPEIPVIEGKEPTEFQKFYDYLALMKFEPNGDICKILHTAAGKYTNISSMYVISSRSDEDFGKALSTLALTCGSVRLIVPKLRKDEKAAKIAGVSVSEITSADELLI